MNQIICDECKKVVADDVDQANNVAKSAYVHITVHETSSGEIIDTDICFNCLKERPKEILEELLEELVDE
jgi:hypothetical protein